MAQMMKDKSAIGSIGKVMLIYLIIGFGVTWADAACKGQAALAGGECGFSATTFTTRENITRDALQKNIPTDISQGSGVLPSGLGILDVFSPAWGMVGTLVSVVSWPATVGETLGVSADVKMVGDIGIFFTALFFVALFYWIRSGY